MFLNRTTQAAQACSFQVVTNIQKLPFLIFQVPDSKIHKCPKTSLSNVQLSCFACMVHILSKGTKRHRQLLQRAPCTQCHKSPLQKYDFAKKMTFQKFKELYTHSAAIKVFTCYLSPNNISPPSLFSGRCNLAVHLLTIHHFFFRKVFFSSFSFFSTLGFFFSRSRSSFPTLVLPQKDVTVGAVVLCHVEP